MHRLNFPVFVGTSFLIWKQIADLESPFLRDVGVYKQYVYPTIISKTIVWNYTSSTALILHSSVQLLCSVQLFATPWATARQASLSITNPRSSPIESVMPSNHLLLHHPLLLLPSIFPITRVFSNESALLIRWPNYWSLSFNISPSNEYSGLISFRMDWLDLLAVQGTFKSLL